MLKTMFVGNQSSFNIVQHDRWPNECSIIDSFFVLGIELFGRALKNNKSIKGILVNNHEIKVTQYADDTTVFVRDRDSVVQLLDFLQNYFLDWK